MKGSPKSKNPIAKSRMQIAKRTGAPLKARVGKTGPNRVGGD